LHPIIAQSREQIQRFFATLKRPDFLDIVSKHYLRKTSGTVIDDYGYVKFL
jgi:hypothetical protein